MDKAEAFERANQEPYLPVIGLATGRELCLRVFDYGALVPDHDHPLSMVSVSNSSLSIDIWAGCAWQCRYCHVQGALVNLTDRGRMARVPRRRGSFSIEAIVDSLIGHPFFLPNESVLSIGTSSTEPFASGRVIDSTFEIMDAFVRKGLRNPFWIVTKNGIPRSRGRALSRITSAGVPVIISLSWAGLPAEIEPMRNDRFANLEEAASNGAQLHWFMRPLVSQWGSDGDRIESMMRCVSKRARGMITAIVAGGLRWTQGVENGVVEIHRLTMPDIPRDDNSKSLPTTTWEGVVRLASDLLPGVPVFKRSSCALGHALGRSSLNCIRYFSQSDCDESICPEEQRQLCDTSELNLLSIQQAQRVLDRLGVPARALGITSGQGLVTIPELSSFTYAVQQTVLKHLAAWRRL